MESSGNWQVGRTLNDRLFYMLQHNLMCDVTFLLGSDETPVTAHKFMMASASPVFYSMFIWPMAEQDTVKIPDIESNVFNVILRFVYTDEINVDSTNVKGLLYSSDKYMLHAIKDKCTQYMLSYLDNEHACDVLQAAYNYHVDDLNDKALNYIWENGSACLQSETFLSLSPECLKQIIESDHLICQEEIVYKRTIDWAKVQCKKKKITPSDKNIRSALGDLLYLIRFPIIEKQYFVENVSKNDILTAEEKEIVNKAYDNEPNVQFSSKGRQPSSKESDLIMLRCEVNRCGDWSQDGGNDCIDFTASKDCTLAGVLVFGSATYSGQHDITLELLQSSVMFNSTTQTLHSVPGKEMYPIKFEKASPIAQNIRYTIRLNMTGPTVFSGKNYQTLLQESGLSVTISHPSEISDNSTSESAGQIPGIILRIEN